MNADPYLICLLFPYFRNSVVLHLEVCSRARYKFPRWSKKVSNEYCPGYARNPRLMELPLQKISFIFYRPFAAPTWGTKIAEIKIAVLRLRVLIEADCRYIR